jgi:hypothetical protein
LGFHVFWLLFLSAGLTAVAPIRDARRRLATPGGPDDAPAPEKLPEFLHARKPATASTSAPASSTS